MKFEVIYSEWARGDFRAIFRYIATDLLAPETAKKWSGIIMTEIDGLHEMPYRNPLSDKEPWRSRELRKWIVGNFIVFYLPMDKTKQALILAVLYGKRNISEMLNDL